MSSIDAGTSKTGDARDCKESTRNTPRELHMEHIPFEPGSVFLAGVKPPSALPATSALSPLMAAVIR